MSLVARYLNRPHLLTSFVLLAAVVGLSAIADAGQPVPDSERPQVAVVTVVRGASAEDVEARSAGSSRKKCRRSSRCAGSPR